ncbi:MAG: FG-GAP repeat domain-containing protein, partial [Terriglobia bacterium]
MRRQVFSFALLAITPLVVGAALAQAPRSEPEPIPALSQKAEPKTKVDSILVNVETGHDGWVTELYDEEIKVQLGVLKKLLGHRPIEREKLSTLVAPEFRGTPLRPTRTLVTLREESPHVARYQLPPPTPSVHAHQLADELEAWLDELEEVISKELKTTRISLERPEPPLAQMQIRYNFTGRTRSGEILELSGYWQTQWRKDHERGWLWAGVTLEEGWESRTPRFHFTDITTCALSAGPAYDQLLRGTDWWSANLDGATSMDVYGNTGMALADIDGDGHEDFYVCQGAGLPNRLFRSNGDGTFTEIARKAGVDVLDRISASLFFDYDNDGDQDLLLTGMELFLFENDGKGHFTLLDAARIGLKPSKDEKAIFFSTCVADYNRDGWLDIYVCSYLWQVGHVGYRYPIPYYDANNGAPNFLFRNNGEGTFTEVTEEVGLDANNTRFSFACAWADYDENGYPDLYVANDFGRNNLYRNNGDGTFTDAAPDAGVEDIGAGMSVTWGDYNNDGWMDLYVGNMYSTAGTRTTMQSLFKSASDTFVRKAYRRHAKGNSLFRNRGDGT